jgi:hypothetical protein
VKSTDKRTWGILLLPVLALLASPAQGQTISQETRNRVTTPATVDNLDPQRWSQWEAAYDGDFPWTPRNFWKGYIKTTPSGKKAGIFVAYFVFQHKLRPGEMQEAVTSGFAEAGAGVSGSAPVNLGDYYGEEVMLESRGGNGLFFNDPDRGVPTSASFVSFELEKERDRDVYPFLAFFFAAPSVDFHDVKPEFDAFLQGSTIQSLPASIAGRVLDQVTGVGVPDVRLQLYNMRTSKVVTGLTNSDGVYRFDSLTPASYNLTVIEATGRKLPLIPTILELASGQDTSGIILKLEPVVAAVSTTPSPATVKPRPSLFESYELPPFRVGLGYRHGLNEFSGIALNARIGDFTPEVGFGLNLLSAGGYSDHAFAAMAGLHYAPWSSGNAHFGVGLVWTGSWQNDARFENSFQLPVTAEYFLAPRLSVQASAGPLVNIITAPDSTASIRWLIGPGNLTGSLGFTWYLK